MYQSERGMILCRRNETRGVAAKMVIKRPIDKKLEFEKVCNVVGLLLAVTICIPHQLHADNISNVIPLIKESPLGRYKQFDFSENLAMELKFEDVHSSGR